MPEHTGFQLAQIVTTRELSELQQQTLLETVLEAQSDTLLTASQCSIAWLYALLVQLPWLKPEAVWLILRHLRTELLLESDPRAPLKIVLVFADAAFATWTNREGWLDLKTGDSCRKPPVTPMESIAYNLTELFRRNMARTQAQHASPSPRSEPRDVPESLGR